MLSARGASKSSGDDRQKLNALASPVHYPSLPSIPIFGEGIRVQRERRTRNMARIALGLGLLVVAACGGSAPPRRPLVFSALSPGNAHACGLTTDSAPGAGAGMKTGGSATARWPRA